MAQRDLLNRSLDAGKDVTQRTQDRIEALLNDLAKNAEEQRTQAQQVVQDLVERSIANTEQLVEAIDREIRGQINAVGLATKADIVRLEKRIEAVIGRARPAVAKRAAAAASASPAEMAPA